MKESVLDIKLANLSVGGEGDRENELDSRGLNNRTEGLIEIHAMLLIETGQHPKFL
jgi:hypothetical protein